LPAGFVKNKKWQTRKVICNLLYKLYNIVFYANQLVIEKCYGQTHKHAIHVRIGVPLETKEHKIVQPERGYKNRIRDQDRTTRRIRGKMVN
jgi:hypothetical protein